MASSSKVLELPRLLVLLIRLYTLVDKQSGVATIIDDEIGAAAYSLVEAPISAPLVLLEGLSFPGEDSGGVAGDGGGGVVLGGEDVAEALTDLGAEGGKGFNEDSGLDGHAEGSKYLCANRMTIKISN
ncbi:hypothetical protein MRB53_010354 [Persea americana]|uniref:Uncharacterized protein n=1 Tax=Persea americana TaxID=3435 RepID=A0ACC2LRM7_PERAE|nr:hypothetical protein MRB53_010354 [Persea americana]